MHHLPIYLWIATYAAVAGIAGATVYVLYRGGRSAGQSVQASARLAGFATLIFTGWLAASTLMAARGLYRTRLGHGVPWLPIAVLGFLAALIALSRVRPVAAALSAPGALRRVMWPHSFRMEGAVFIIAMLLGSLPALFAIPAGLGDMTVAVLTPVVAASIAKGTHSRALFWFSVFGVADLVSALTLGALTGFQILTVHPSASLNSQVPLALVPTVGVPLLFALHITTFGLLRRDKSFIQNLAQRVEHKTAASASIG